ncbi:hypothetical protein [Streptomyces sp. NPDC015680]|uniref:hypothetical protein n=1 Tax=Streptomyces sp. NPDC015680 TaxID=3364962 RepID=UPI0036FCB2EA
MATTDANRRLDPDVGLLEVIRPLVEGAVHELDALVEERVRTSDDPVMADPGHILDVVRATAPAADLLGHVQRTLVLDSTSPASRTASAARPPRSASPRTSNCSARRATPSRSGTNTRSWHG